MAAEDHDFREGYFPPKSLGKDPLDELARGLASGTISRRKALKWMGGVLLGGVLASVPAAAWAARPLNPGRPPAAGPPAEPGPPPDPGTPPVVVGCGQGPPCGTNELGNPLTCCNGTCVDLSSDRNNCGECGKVCTFPCTNGRCGNVQCDPAFPDICVPPPG
jgi:hypothetical protein